MSERLNALDLLVHNVALSADVPSLVVMVGDEQFLSLSILAMLRDVLCPDEADRAWAWREFSGADELDPRDVFDEAATVPLFAGATRAAVVRDADAFVTAARERLETLVQSRRGSRGVVILDVRTFPSNTRLAKAAAKDGLVIDVSTPQKYDLAGWVRKWAKIRYAADLAAASAQRLLERLGGSLGQVDQALQRLAAATDPAAKKKTIPPEAIDDIAGSPQERTAWGMIDAAADGRTAQAIANLADLIEGGENPIGIGAQMGSVLRRLSTAARLLSLPPAEGRPPNVDAALREAGVAAWPKAMIQAKESLVHLGPQRARRLPVWLLELDGSLKGEASRGLRARLALERFFCKMSGPATPGRPAAKKPGGRS
ncbi:MAG: DNA polymerase III subunit delta [Planctomycetia bacterium]